MWTDELLELVAKYNSHDVLASEKKMFDARRASWQSQVSVLLSQEKQLGEQIKGMREELAATQEIMATLTEELGAKRELFKRKYLEKTQILELERQLATHKGNHGKLRQSIAAATTEGRSPSAAGRLEHQRH